MKNFDDTKAAGQHFRGGRIQILSQRVISYDKTHKGAIAIDVKVRAQKLVTLDSQNRTVGVDPARSGLKYRLWVRWIGGKWRLVDYSRVIQQ